MVIRAIETTYRGCRFRSRLEARWAVFFDALGIVWEYEKEGFELPSGRYLPDFWLPRVQVGCWLEVKGQEPTEHERVLARELANGSGDPVYIFSNAIDADINTYYGNTHAGSIWSEWTLSQPEATAFFPDGPTHTEQRFAICGDCGLIGIVGGGSAGYLPCQDPSWKFCRHCHQYEDRHRLSDGDLICQPSEESYFEPPWGWVPASRAALLERNKRSVFQNEILSRRCDCAGIQLRDQMQRLKAAFDRARGARFEFGESG